MREIYRGLYEIEAFYLDYFNNYTTVKEIAKFYGITESKALAIINVGKLINHSGVRMMDESEVTNE